MESLTPSAAYASPTAKPAAINAVVPRRAFFICLSLVLVQADASTGPPETHRPSERPKIRNSPNRTAAGLAPSYGWKSYGDRQQGQDEVAGRHPFSAVCGKNATGCRRRHVPIIY